MKTIDEIKKEYKDKFNIELNDYQIKVIQKQDTINADIKLNGCDVTRISFYSDEAKKVIKEYITNNDIPVIRDGKVNAGWGFGNYCICFLRIKDADKLIENLKEYKIVKDLHRHYIGKNEVKDFKIGDKVYCYAENFFGGIAQSKGTIYNITDNQVTIRKYRSKTKGWILNFGDVGKIEKR